LVAAAADAAAAAVVLSESAKALPGSRHKVGSVSHSGPKAEAAVA
jgi:hypothetical protein